jgi:hypothetical protein
VQLLGVSADELAAQRSADEASFGSTLQSCKWSEWLMTLAARSREYNGERRMRYTVVRVSGRAVTSCKILYSRYAPFFPLPGLLATTCLFTLSCF